MKVYEKPFSINLHEIVQAYFDKKYSLFENDIKQSLFSKSNEIYGELYYYSVIKLLKYLKLTEVDHFLDVGSGLGKLVFQVFLTTDVLSVAGIEINEQRYNIAHQIKNTITQELPELFNRKRELNLLKGDFLQQHFENITVVYICSTVFSFELLNAISKKINTMNNVRKVISLRKLPNLDKFKLSGKIFLQGSWDYTACYVYSRKK